MRVWCSYEREGSSPFIRTNPQRANVEVKIDVRLADLKAISDFDLPAKSVMISVALGKIVGVLGNEARMVIRYLHMGQREME